MRSNRVVVFPPIANDLRCFVQRSEPVLVQAFVSEFAVEAFDKWVLSRLAWLYELQFSTVAFGPFKHGFRGP